MIHFKIRLIETTNHDFAENFQFIDSSFDISKGW